MQEQYYKLDFELHSDEKYNILSDKIKQHLNAIHDLLYDNGFNRLNGEYGNDTTEDDVWNYKYYSSYSNPNTIEKNDKNTEFSTNMKELLSKYGIENAEERAKEIVGNLNKIFDNRTTSECDKDEKKCKCEKQEYKCQEKTTEGLKNEINDVIDKRIDKLLNEAKKKMDYMDEKIPYEIPNNKLKTCTSSTQKDIELEKEAGLLPTDYCNRGAEYYTKAEKSVNECAAKNKEKRRPNRSEEDKKTREILENTYKLEKDALERERTHTNKIQEKYNFLPYDSLLTWYLTHFL